MTTQGPIRSASSDRCGSLAATRQTADTLRYDNLVRVPIDLDERVHVPTKPRRERKPVADHAALVELRAHVTVLKAEHDRFAARILEEVDGLAERLAQLEARMRRPWWWRVWARSEDLTDLAERRRERARERLQGLFLHRMESKHRPS
jgi:hypothetical protein